MRFAAALLIAFLLASCASGPGTRPSSGPDAPSTPVAQFPEVARVRLALEGEPPELASIIPDGERHVDEWTIESEPAPGDLPYDPEGDPFEALLDSIAAEGGHTLRRSGALRCAAREAARFYARNEASPTQRLTRFMLAACGSSAAYDFIRAGTSATLRGQPSPERTAELARDAVSGQFREVLAMSDRLVGLGVAREGSRVAIVLMAARPAASLEPWGTANELGEVHLRGRVTIPADAITAMINQGELGVAPCRIEPTVALPDIDVRCPMAPGDETAVVSMQAIRIGRVLAERVATLLVRRTPDAPAVFHAGASSETAADGAALDARLLAQVNAIRQRAGLAPLTLAPAESAVHGRAAPYALAARTGRSESEDLSEVLALGLMAGWGVEGGTIRSANHVEQIETGTTDPAQWVAACISHPIGRYLLLRPEARQVAIGAVEVSDPPAIGAVVTTYTFFDTIDPAAEASRYFARVTEARTRRGLPPPRRIEQLGALEREAALVSSGRAQPRAAFQRGLDLEGQRMRRPLRGLHLEALDLEHAPLPDELFRARDLALGVVVGHTRAPGAAWGQFVVFLVLG